MDTVNFRWVRLSFVQAFYDLCVWGYIDLTGVLEFILEMRQLFLNAANKSDVR